MSLYELRDGDDARCFVLQGLWGQRVLPPRPAGVRPALEWALEVAASGQELPPTGFLADLGHVAFGEDHEAGDRGAPPPGFPAALLRTYEDHVLGKFYADWTFARAADALRRYHGRDRARGLAFLYRRFAERAGFRGARLSPGVVKSLLEPPPEEVHAEGWESLGRDGLHEALAPLYEELIAAARRTAEVLGPEDVSQLERGTALRPEGEQLAERQVLRAAAWLEATLPRHRPRTPPGRRDVPTHVLDEDTYPVGGFSSLSTRGSLESLLHSQLAYMEKDQRPDLFDVKYLRDELLYYARDENQFLRRRRTFAVVLYPDLDQTRFKDRGLDFQRGVLLLALLYTAVRKLSEWLSTDALVFRFVFVAGGADEPLRPERELLASLLTDEIANGTVELRAEPEARLAACCGEWARRSLCHALLVDVRPHELRPADTCVNRLVVAGPRPVLEGEEEGQQAAEEDEPMDSWAAALHELLRRWL